MIDQGLCVCAVNSSPSSSIAVYWYSSVYLLRDSLHKRLYYFKKCSNENNNNWFTSNPRQTMQFVDILFFLFFFEASKDKKLIKMFTHFTNLLCNMIFFLPRYNYLFCMQRGNYYL